MKTLKSCHHVLEHTLRVIRKQSLGRKSLSVGMESNIINERAIEGHGIVLRTKCEDIGRTLRMNEAQLSTAVSFSNHCLFFSTLRHINNLSSQILSTF